jgi:pimeloyl-ACP methyl ester carboxylesterase
MIPPPAERAMSERAGSTVTEAPGSHSIYVSPPRATAELIARAAREARVDNGRPPIMTARNINPRRRRSLAAGAIAVALAIVAVAASALASSHRTRAAQTKPTIVLVHGGWADSSGWNREVSALQRRGYPVIAPANPLRGLAPTPRTCAASCRPSMARSCSSAIPTAAP